MRETKTELKVGIVALLVTIASAGAVTVFWYQDHQVSREFVREVQRNSAALQGIPVTEGQVAKWTDEIRKTETVKGEMEQHFLEQIRKVRSHEYSEEEFNRHLMNCKRLCGQLVEKMIAASAEEIVKEPHDVAFFDLNQDVAGPKFQQRATDFARKNKNRNIFIIGRASLIGGADYNKELSARRVKNVKAILRKAGINEEQIKTLWIGFEAPQLTRAQADLYRIDPREYKEDLFQLNQSVLYFTYSGEPYFPTFLSRTEEKVQKGIPQREKGSTKKSS
jgi:outer membrane protein OmpA-like peptidoglycan-associated protein